MAGDWHSLYRDPQWQKKRLEILERAGWCCENCGDSESELQVHHGYYDKDKKPWEYETESLHCLCELCHEDAEDIRQAIKLAGKLSIKLQKQIALLIDAFLFQQSEDEKERHGKRVEDLTFLIIQTAQLEFYENRARQLESVVKKLQGGSGGRRLD